MYLKLIIYLFLLTDFILIESCKIFADLTSNRLTRVQDGSVGLWSFHGTAKESHAIQTTFTFNADLIDEQSFYNGISKHSNLATLSEPYLGLTSDTDVDYMEYLILQAQTANIDGFILEWGYKGHPSDFTLHRLINILKKPKFSKRKFCIGINWCEHWLKVHLKNSSKMAEAFYKNGQYLLESFFIPYFTISHRHNYHPVILLFGGGITSYEFSEVITKKFNVPPNMKQPIWIGNYLNTASTIDLRNQWIKLLNGSFAWITHSRSTPFWLNAWDTYSLPEDTVNYQKEVRNLSVKLKTNKTWNYWMASANPGEDNRGCAGWGQTLKYVPRLWNGINTYDSQWQYNLNSSSDAIIIPTLNDYSEATVILPTVNYGFSALISTLKYTSLWKNKEPNYQGLKQPSKWFMIKKDVSFLKHFHAINVSKIIKTLNKAFKLIIRKDYTHSDSLLEYLRFRIDRIKETIPVVLKRFYFPSKEIYPVNSIHKINDSYLIDYNQPLFLQMNNELASILQKKYFKGMLTFDYQSLSSEYSVLRVQSSTNRRERGSLYTSINYNENLNEKLAYGDFKIVCQLMQNQIKKWSHTAVELFKENQSWNHNGPYSSDIIYLSDTKNSLFLIKNISLSFFIFN